jgi:hypothetical protein
VASSATRLTPPSTTGAGIVLALPEAQQHFRADPSPRIQSRLLGQQRPLLRTAGVLALACDRCLVGHHRYTTVRRR